jgi:hypothetical protein
VRIFGRPQNQIVPFNYIYKAGIAFNYFDRKIQNAIECLVKAVGCGNAADCVVQNLRMRIIKVNRRSHE